MTLSPRCTGATSLLVAALLSVSVAPFAGAAPAQSDDLVALEAARKSGAQDKGKSGKGGLILPSSKRPEESGPTTGASTPAAGAGTSDPAQQPANAPPKSERSPTDILAELAARTKFSASEARGYAEELLAHGEDGLSAARRGIASDTQSVLLSCARAVLLAQDPAGLGLIRGRLARDLPSEAVAPLLRAIDELSPASLAIPDLIALLDHPQAVMRSTVERLLSERVTSADLDLLARALSAERTDTRLRVLDLVGRMSTPEALELLFKQLDDAKPTVAQRAAQLLALRPEPDVVTRLEEIAFSTQLLFRRQAYALLSLIEREDQVGIELVGASRVPLLLANLSSVAPFSRGAAAVALAGVGYRSISPENPQWFQLTVPHELVSIVSGTLYHKDFAALQVPALRRLERITGRSIGNDGPAWQSWWIASAANFAPRRAVLPDGALAVESIRIEWSAAGGPLTVLAASGAPVVDQSRPLWLDQLDAEKLVAELGAAGVFGAQRLPGAPTAGETDRLCVAVGTTEKVFTFPPGVHPNWLAAVKNVVADLAAQNDWQTLVDPGLPGAKRGLFVSEAPWWRIARATPGADGAVLRARRKKELALEALLTQDPNTRAVMVAELLAAYRLPGVLDTTDARSLLTIVETEPYHSPRTASLVQVLIETGRAEPGGALDRDFGRDLFDRLYERFRGGALDSLARVTEALGLEFARELTGDSRSLARALSAPQLAHSLAEEDTERLELLLVDGEVELVQESAIAAIGAAERHDLRRLVLARSEGAPLRVRQAAITALGQLGGPGALDAMVVCFAGGELELCQTALRAMGHLDDPHAAEIVVQLLARGPEYALFDAARETAVAMGSKARLALSDLASNERAAGRAEAAFVLAELGAVEAVPVLLALLQTTGDAADRAAEELAVLSCLDLRARADRGMAWRAWWEASAQRDPLAWLRDAQFKQGLPVAPPGSLEQGGTRDGALALAATVEAPAGVLSERARRELVRLLGEPVQRPPERGDIAAWRAALDFAIDRRFTN